MPPQRPMERRCRKAQRAALPRVHWRPVTGGKERLGGISKRGDAYLRKLLIHGVRAAVHRVRAHQVPGAWLTRLLARRHFNIATVALANKTARIAWAVMHRHENYQRVAAAA